MENQNQKLAIVFFGDNSLIVNIDKINHQSNMLGRSRKTITYTILNSKQKSDVDFYDENINCNVDLQNGCVYMIKDIIGGVAKFKDDGYGEIFDEQDKNLLKIINDNPNIDYRDIATTQNILGKKMIFKHNLAMLRREADKSLSEMKRRYPSSNPPTYGE